ncbi:MAG TPA: class I SAM-dependent methyltransferase, partial [Kofleriaceae bacterium]|nr:class I SAM-dependent methyltransferase [Kofleriaceae bacterium]
MATQAEFEAREAEERQQRIAEYDRYAAERDRWRAKNRAYYRNLERLTRFVVPVGANVLEIGSGTGDLLAALEPGRGSLGIDISPKLVSRARHKHPHLDFVVADAETMDAPELAGRTFDYIVMSDVVGRFYDVWKALRSLRRVCHARTRILISYYNFLWEPLLKLGERIGQKMPIPQENWLGMKDLSNLLELNHFEVI